MKFRIPKGLFDLVPEPKSPKDSWKSSYLWELVERKIREVSHQFGFEEIRTPVFECTELFHRGVGESSDIVTKEMYTFQDKGDRSMTLRPEGTAPVMRSVVENQLFGTQKLFYISPMFRYERPQAGRYRQHHQFGVEALGAAAPEQDVEVIDLLMSTYTSLGLSKLNLHVNSVGDPESRSKFRQELKDFLAPYTKDLSSDSQQRLEQNPLRILDSKDSSDKKILETAPSILDCLNLESKKHFERVLEALDLLQISFTVNTNLVRGLDYYNHTVFEVVCGDLGAQNSIGGGGRYDGLVESFGGPELPGVGFGTGMERIIQTMIQQEACEQGRSVPQLFLIPMGDEAKKHCMKLCHRLRKEGHSLEMDFTGKKVKALFKHADSRGYPFVLVMGDDEIATGSLRVKNMSTGDSRELSIDQLGSFLDQAITTPKLEGKNV